MTKKIFRGILFSSFITMLASMVFIIGVQYMMTVSVIRLRARRG